MVLGRRGERTGVRGVSGDDDVVSLRVYWPVVTAIVVRPVGSGLNRCESKPLPEPHDNNKRSEARGEEVAEWPGASYCLGSGKRARGKTNLASSAAAVVLVLVGQGVWTAGYSRPPAEETIRENY